MVIKMLDHAGLVSCGIFDGRESLNLVAGAFCSFQKVCFWSFSGGSLFGCHYQNVQIYLLGNIEVEPTCFNGSGFPSLTEIKWLFAFYVRFAAKN